MTHQELREQYELIRLVESRIREKPLGECAKDANEILADIKRRARKFVRERLGQQADARVFSCKNSSGEICGDCWYEMYSVEFGGTKDELLQQLEEQAEWSHMEVRERGYDCTGLQFIGGYKAAHVTGNRYKVLYKIQLDV